MIKRRVYLILKEDIIKYPPVLSIINILLDMNIEVVHIGVYSDNEQKKHFEKLGARFFDTISYDGKSNLFIKYIQQIKFKKQVAKLLKNENLNSNSDYIWLMQAETITLLNKIVCRYKTIVHFFEYVEPSINWKYKILNPFVSMEEICKKAYKVVCCEYNRAHITKGLFQLESLPVVLPNKVYVSNHLLEDIPDDITGQINEVIAKCKNKKVILYQGIFLDKERRLEEFCKVINLLPSEFILVAMGEGSSLYEELKNKYQSNRILFIPFIRPPYHLLVTKIARIGILSYFPRNINIASVINPLYCAPNKIFEYSKFGVPMISNDIPALSYIFEKYKCGQCINYPITEDAIKNIIMNIDSNYNVFLEGSENYYNSVNYKEIINKILE